MHEWVWVLPHRVPLLEEKLRQRPAASCILLSEDHIEFHVGEQSDCFGGADEVVRMTVDPQPDHQEHESSTDALWQELVLHTVHDQLERIR
jgi:hypothetical protein